MLRDISVGVLQRNRTNRIYVEREICFERLAQALVGNDMTEISRIDGQAGDGCES